jgi:hypothetical protein
MYGYRRDRRVLERSFALDHRQLAGGFGIIQRKPMELPVYRFERELFFKFPLYAVDYLGS